MKILYIDGVGPFGGASRSLFEVMRALPPEVEAYFVMQDGTARHYYQQVARDIIATRGLTRIDHTRFSHYRGVRWLVLLRELAYIPFMIAALVRARLRWSKFDAIHVNEVLEIVPGLVAKALFRAPLIYHCRSLQMNDRSLWRTRVLHELLRRYADRVIAIDEGVRATLSPGIKVEVIHNSFEPTPEGVADNDYLAPLEGLRGTSLKVGFVGNLHRAKGLPELLEAAKILHDQGEDTQFLIVGGVTQHEQSLAQKIAGLVGIAQNVEGKIHETVADMGLAGEFLLLGPTGDIQRVYRRMDVLVFPSYYDAPGRPVFESAFFGIPSIVAVRAPREDTVIQGETAIAIPEPRPDLIASAILHFVRNRGEVARMGANAKALAERNYVPQNNAKKLFALYQDVIRKAKQR